MPGTAKVNKFGYQKTKKKKENTNKNQSTEFPVFSEFHSVWCGFGLPLHLSARLTTHPPSRLHPAFLTKVPAFSSLVPLIRSSLACLLRDEAPLLGSQTPPSQPPCPCSLGAMRRGCYPSAWHKVAFMQTLNGHTNDNNSLKLDF